MSEKHLICTIIAPNYLSQALTLGQSIAKNMPDVSFRILVLQDSDESGKLNSYFENVQYGASKKLDHEFISIRSVDWEDFDIAGSVNRYDLLEFATSVKPAFIRHYLKNGWERVSYIDPDVYIYQDYSELLSKEAAVSLTPHIFSDYPSDGLLPGIKNILMAGIYNLGFISCTSAAMNFLNWWADKLENYCSMEPAEGWHVDQRWVDWAPNFCDVQVIKNPGMNVAYWNLHERAVHFENDLPTVFSESQIFPLYFFHFSGFDDFITFHLSKHTTRNFSSSYLNQKILVDYAKVRTSWNDSIHLQSWQLGGRPQGKALAKNMRMELLSNARLSLHKKNDSERELARSINRKLIELGFKRFSLAWLIENRHTKKEIRRNPTKIQKELEEIGYLESEIIETLEIVNQNLFEPSLKVVGYFAAPTGVGTIARNTVEFLLESNIKFTVQCIKTDFDSPLIYEELQSKYIRATGREDVCLVFINADMWLIDGIASGAIDRNKQLVAAVWAWEIDDIPGHFGSISRNVDEVYAISNFSAKALEKGLKRKVKMLPTFLASVKKQTLDSTGTNSVNMHVNLPEKYILVRFDSKSVIKRKNPIAAIQAWKSIHKDFPDYHLVIKTTDFRRLSTNDEFELITNAPQTILIDEEFTVEMNEKLLLNAKCYLSLHRAEGLGLNILESIFSDVPAVFTNYSGLGQELSGIGFHVDYQLTAVGEGAHPYPSEAIWAEPDIDSAVTQLKLALEQVENGQWKNEYLKRQEWIADFLTKNRSTFNGEIKSLFEGAKNIEHRFSRYEFSLSTLRRRLFLNIDIQKFLPIWRKLPVTQRQWLKPKILKLYFSLLKKDSNPNDEKSL